MESDKIAYPRKTIPRAIARFLGHSFLPFAFRIQLEGQINFPKTGPYIIVGNHNAIMEVVLMVVYVPQQVEVLGSTDVPHEPLLNFITQLYGYIPYIRGRLEREPLRQALFVLEQGGVLGIFPEGGIWQISERRVQPGVAWLSEKSQAPVLPIRFNGTGGAVNKAIKLQRPTLSMRVGEMISPAKNTAAINHKQFLQKYATQVMDAVDALRPSDAVQQQVRMRDEQFRLIIDVMSKYGLWPVEIPDHLQIKNPEALAKLLHYPTILKIFKVNLHMKVDALQDLSSQPEAGSIAAACKPILKYLRDENPYLLTYRFGQREGDAMKIGLISLLELSEWADKNNMILHITPMRQYYDLATNQLTIQTKQGNFKSWM
jgi:1-acyl-sn-glycerol-3-phosphate acyltransferase